MEYLYLQGQFTGSQRVYFTGVADGNSEELDCRTIQQMVQESTPEYICRD